MFAPGLIYPETVIRIPVTFTDSSGTAVDPTTVEFRTRAPNGVEATYTYGTDAEITKASTGNYRADFAPDVSGRWVFRWKTTGTGTTVATEGTFNVQYSPFFDDSTDYYAP